ncbi:EAL domain-containing protein [Pseudoduganella sp. DS3]|uniref:EAL domain-containing protein n=1 Tax=Pseudoduganella guangdongensis TaxID=2692179 RepID=A0A6N9HAT6_9BURK|nr:EAL domain-containing protein [Pseudoduganella guangdongensis]MYN00570.1 EAL domain-containing protein [Pseudoduganella guangdongensis]
MIGNALELGEFELWCHPHVAAHDGSIASVQAEVRWRRQDGRLAAPGAIARAFPTATMQELFVLHMVCDALAALRMWSAEGFELNIVLALPVPQARLEAPGTRGLVAGLLAQAGLAPARLVLRGSVDGACCEVADLLDWLRVRGAGCAQAAGEFIATPQPVHVLPAALRRWQASYAVMSAADAFS